MSMEYSEEHSVFKCSICGNLEIIEMVEQPSEDCQKCEEIKMIKKDLESLYYISTYCGFKNNNCKEECIFCIEGVCGFKNKIPENWEFLNRIRNL